MTVSQIIHQFATDNQTKAILALVVLDFVFGVLAAVKLGTFALSYVANFARNDVLSKVAPFLLLSAAADVAGGTNIVIPGLDLSLIVHGAFIVIAAAMVGSLVSSLADLGFPLPAALGRGNPPVA